METQDLINGALISTYNANSLIERVIQISNYKEVKEWDG
jgi:hypothetical protein